VRRLLGALLLLGGLLMTVAPAQAQYCGAVGGNTGLYSSTYTGGLYPTYPSTYGGFYGYPYYGGEYPYPAYGGYYPYSANFLNNYAFFGAGGYYPFQTYGSFYPQFGDAYYMQPALDYGYRGRPAYTGYYYGGLPFYGGQSGSPLQPYSPYPLAGGNYGSAPSLYPGAPSYTGGYAPYSSALYLPTFFTGGQPSSVLYC
jgi:hypothetical protein